MNVPTKAESRAKEPNRLWTLLIALLMALLVTMLLTPFLLDRLNRFWPASTNAAVDSFPQSSANSPGNEWPTPPSKLLATSDLVVDTAVPTSTSMPRPTPTLRALPTPAWREISYLTSTRVTASTIVEAERTTSIALLGDITTDQLLLKAVGNVLIGVDLSRVSNVEVEGRKIRLSLPDPEVIAVELLPEKSQIYDKASVLFLSQYDGLETDALDQAQAQLRSEVAENDSLIKLARDLARLQLTEFLESTGFRSVEIDFPGVDVRSNRG